MRKSVKYVAALLAATMTIGGLTARIKLPNKVMAHFFNVIFFNASFHS